MEGKRFDEGKIRFDLVPPEPIAALARHYTVGAAKYADRNWEKGMKWSRCLASLKRHLDAWERGEEWDQETGSHHLVAVMWNAAGLFVYFVRGIGEDDRPKIADVPLWQAAGESDIRAERGTVSASVVSGLPPVARSGSLSAQIRGVGPGSGISQSPVDMVVRPDFGW